MKTPVDCQKRKLILRVYSGCAHKILNVLGKRKITPSAGFRESKSHVAMRKRKPCTSTRFRSSLIAAFRARVPQIARKTHPSRIAHPRLQSHKIDAEHYRAISNKETFLSTKFRGTHKQIQTKFRPLNTSRFRYISDTLRYRTHKSNKE